MNQCARTFILTGLVVGILLALHFLPPLSVGDTKLRRVNVLSDVLPEEMKGHDALDFVPAMPQVPLPVAAVATADSTVPPAGKTAAAEHAVMADSALSALPAEADSSAAVVVARPVTIDTAHTTTPILDYSQGQPGGMARFYSLLAQARAMERPVRVAYYGDSFIEGDIFTADLRTLLQDEFGGNGVGWVDCGSEVYGFRQTVSHAFSGLTEYEVVKRPFSTASQGIAQRYFTAQEGARITLKGTRTRRHTARWDRAIFYLRTEDGLRLRTTVNGDTTIVDTIGGAQHLQTVVHDGGYDQADSLLRTRSMTSVSYVLTDITPGTLLYGIALEPRQGVVVDNFSMRGSAGYTLAQIPAATLAQFAAARPYDLIVLHYGLNVANSQQGNYSSYAKNMGKAIEHLRQAFPQAAILVVSVPDRDQRTDAGLHTMRGVEQLVAYQQFMASEHGVAFFNLFEAMGGRESMMALVDRGLANKDYTHINFAGGKHLARLLFEGMMAGYHGCGY